MEKETKNNIRLGVFVLIGTLFLVISMYLIGSKRNLFGKSFKVNSLFYNVNGLIKGNNIRYSGIDVGTVESVQIINDTAIQVVMLIDSDKQKFIKKNSTVAIGTDGLMGNKIVNILSQSGNAAPVAEGDTLKTVRPIDTDVVMRTLNTTNENVEAITSDLRNITRKFNSNNTIWSILLDTIVAQNLKQSIVNIRVTSANTLQLTGDLSQVMQNIKQGKGSVGALLVDTTLSHKLERAIVNIELTGKNSATASGNLDKIVQKINKGEGTIGALIMDTTAAVKINQSLENIRKGSAGFNENMEAIKQVPFIRSYFKKKEKEAKKAKK